MSEAAHEASEGVPEYMISYADMITIMMCFFVVLYATTSGSGKQDKGHDAAAKPAEGEKTKQAGGKGAGTEGAGQAAEGAGQAADGDRSPGAGSEQLQRVFDSLYYRFGPGWTATNCWVGGPAGLRASAEQGGRRSGGPARAGRFARGRPDESGIGLQPPDRHGCVIPAGRICFAESSAELSPQEKRQLGQVAGELAGKLQKIELRGHTSRQPLPPGSPWRDHADLAYARCRAVQEELVALGIDPRRIRLAVAADREPVETGGDPLRIRQNSRVDIHLLNEWLPKAAAAAADLPPRRHGEHGAGNDE